MITILTYIFSIYKFLSTSVTWVHKAKAKKNVVDFWKKYVDFSWIEILWKKYVIFSSCSSFVVPMLLIYYLEFILQVNFSKLTLLKEVVVRLLSVITLLCRPYIFSFTTTTTPAALSSTTTALYQRVIAIAIYSIFFIKWK